MDLNEKFQRRTLILGGLKGAFLLGLMGRLYNLQILNKDHFQTLSDKNRIHNFLILPDRGLIVDANGIVLADSKNTYISLLDRDFKANVLLKKIQEYIELSEQDHEWIEKQLARKKSLEPILIKDNLSYAEVAQIEYHLPELEGVRTDSIRSRNYPTPLPFAHALGFVGTVTQKEKASSESSLLSAPGFKIGKTGIEKTYDIELTGAPGIRKVEVNAYRKIVRTLSNEESISGKKLVLNIDFDLQSKIYDLLTPHFSGACAVMDTHTGALKAFVSNPGFDTNLFVKRISHKDWKELADNPYKPLVNKLTSGLYAPGSTFKMIVALAALEKGVVKELEAFYCNGHFDLNGHKFHCHSWKTGGHGSLNLTQAIAASCDVYFYQLAMRLKIDEIADMAMRFGLGSKTGIDLPSEKIGLIPTTKWKLEKHGKKWALGETVNVSIGQGTILTTPLQLCRMMTALVNGGRLLTPHLVNGNVYESTVIDVDPNHLKIVLKGMADVVNAPYGTAYSSRIQKKGFEMGGKSGTTQVVRITEEQRKTGLVSSNDHFFQEHALFVGYAPIINPRFATVVLVEHGKSGGRVAAPIAREALTMAQAL